jgi:hypothetical protein
MSEKTEEYICCDDGTCAASGEYEGWVRYGCHVTCCGWDSQVCVGFSFHEYDIVDMFTQQ